MFKEEEQQETITELTEKNNKVYKVSLGKLIIITIFILVLIVAIVLGINFLTNSNQISNNGNENSNSLATTYDKSLFSNYIGDWFYTTSKENDYWDGVAGASVSNYYLCVQNLDGYDVLTFVLGKQSYFHKQTGKGLYEEATTSQRNEFARGILLNEGEKIYLYFDNVDFETVNFTGEFKDAIAITDYGLRGGDQTRILVTSDNYNVLTIYTPDGEMVFKK